jgi:LuxR family maltose regulon positive regulatory protein
MITPLLKTKLYMPSVRTVHVTRPRLLDHLNKDLGLDAIYTRKLTLICAPAGYGKTTLVVDWLNTLSLQIAWFSLDEGDNDPVRFLTYLITAIKEIHLEFGAAALEMLQSPQVPPPEILISTLLNEISAIESPFVLVLDDYHLIQTPLIHQHLNFLVEHLPPQMHMVIATREDPPLPLSRLRARGQLLEIRQMDIRFTLEETTSYLENVISRDLSSENIAAVERRTEGWVTGMQLLALSLQKHPDTNEFIRSFTGSDRYVLDYLFEEVFNRQAEGVQDFLLKTSILDNLSAGLCEAVTRRTDSGEILESLDHANLFILPKDQTQTWYRYHRLFLELLQHRLRMNSEISLQELHSKASQWYQDQGYLENAIQHALKGNDWERSAALICQVSDALLKGGAIVTMIKWFKKIPAEVIFSNPEYCLTHAWTLLLTGLVNEADPFLNAAEDMAGDDTLLLGQIASAQAFQAQTLGDEPCLIERSELALRLLPEDDLSSRSILALNLGIAYWHNGEMANTERVLNEALPAARQTNNKYVEISALFFLARVYAVKGQLQRAFGFFSRIVDVPVRVPIVALAHLDLSAIHMEWNDLNNASLHLEKGMEMIGTGRNLEFQIAGLMQKARLQVAQGEVQGALDTLDECTQIEDVNEIPARTRSRKAACAVEVCIAAGDLDGATRWAERAVDELDAHPFYRYLYLTPVRLLLAQNKFPEAYKLLEKAYRSAHQAGWAYGLIAIHLMQTLAAPNNAAALDAITDALNLAQPEKFMRSFVDGGTGLVPVLTEAARRGVHPQYVGDILSAIEGQPGEGDVTLPPGIEPLSNRELEVLRLLAAGLTNRQIAEQLVVSISTVKSHVHHICGKLGVSNRSQAVARSRQLGLI